MENNEFIQELNKYVLNEDVMAVSKEVNELKVRFEDFIIEAERKEQVKQLEAQEKGETYEALDYRPLKEQFFEIFKVYKERRKLVIEAKNSLEAENLKQKRALITRLKEVIEKEEHVGLAFNAYKEIHETWKTIGDIARDKRNEIQHEYSRLLEDFFFNLKIYRELKDHDLKRNKQLKLDVISQLEALGKNESFKEIEASLKLLQNQWDEIGPVVNEDWENLMVKYWENVRIIYDRINNFYDERRISLLENLKNKKELLSETAAIIAEISTYNSVKMWEMATEKLLAFQEKWKSIGFGPRKENEEIWQEFRKLCDSFFASKKEFYSTIQEKFGKVAEEKQNLIEQAKKLKDSTDWKTSAEKLIQLQKNWKNIGHAGQKLEQKLWTEFRAACDAFFNSRQKHFEEQDKQLEVNLLAKQELINAILAYKPSGDKQQVLSDLKEFTNSFNAIGKVPLKEKDSNYNAFKTAINQQYSDLKLEGEEKEKVFFEARMETLSSSPDAQRLFSKEKADLRLQIDKLKAEILQFENNLGFFARSKGADTLRAEVEAKITASKNKIDGLIRKLKMIPNE